MRKMIALIYSKDDWDAIELAFKVQAIASSKGYKIYAPPKNARRDDDEVFVQLNKVENAIFIAFGAKNIDKDSIEELKFLQKNEIPIYFVSPEKLVPKIINLGFIDNIYAFKEKNHKEAIESINKALDEIQAQTINANDQLLGALILIGIILLLLLLFLGKED